MSFCLPWLLQPASVSTISHLSLLASSSSSSSTSGFPPQGPCGSTHAPIHLYLPFTPTRNLYCYDGLCPPPCRLSCLLQTCLLAFDIKSQDIFWMLFHPASRSAIVTEALAFPHHSQHPSFPETPKFSWPARVLPHGSWLLSHFIFSRIAPFPVSSHKSSVTLIAYPMPYSTHYLLLTLKMLTIT